MNHFNIDRISLKFTTVVELFVKDAKLLGGCSLSDPVRLLIQYDSASPMSWNSLITTGLIYGCKSNKQRLRRCKVTLKCHRRSIKTEI